MRVSAVVVNYNHGRYLGAAIDSILAQSRPPDQIVVVDDGSTDDSRAVLRQYPTVTALLQDNSGPSAATNAAVDAVSGDVAVFLDADDLMLPTRVEHVLDAFDNAPAAEWAWHPLRHVERDTGRDLGVDRQAGFEPGLRDLRSEVRRGRLPMTAPATSGLAWRVPFLRAVMPIPASARGQDLYLKFASMALAPGVVLEDVLGLQGIHGGNAYTGRAVSDRRVFGAQNSVEMLPGFAALGGPLDGLAHRFAAEAALRSHLGADLTPSQRRRLIGFVKQLPPRRWSAFGRAVAVTVLRDSRQRARALRPRAGVGS